MSISVVIVDADGDDQGFHLASVMGVNNIVKWVETLPHEESHSLRALFDDGGTTNTVRLKSELRKALKRSPPDNKDMLMALRRLSKQLGTGQPEGSAYLEM